MSSNLRLRSRRIVPRWRTAGVQASLHLEGLGEAGSSPTDESERPRLLKVLRSSDNPFVVSDVMGAAFVLGFGDIAEEAASLIVKRSASYSNLAVEMAHGILSPKHSEGLRPPHRDMETRRVRAAELRRILRSAPHDPLSWLDLAREQAILGQTEAARRPVRIALGLSPFSRLVLRTASRYYLHSGDHGIAHEILHRNDRVTLDPLLLAAEIAAASAAGRTSRYVKRAQRLLATGDFSARDCSELAAALATLEAEAGHRQSAQRLLRRSLEDPTENTVAQCAWLASDRGITSHALEPSHFCTPGSFEANATQTMATENYSDSAKAAWDWLHDEPFASTPAIHGSFVCSMALGRHQEAEEFAREGLLANPNDLFLLNNLTFALASLDRVEEAQSYLNQLQGLNPGGNERPATLATAGLVAYRRGHLSQGRDLYDQAISVARAERKHTQVVWALLLASREETRVDLERAAKLQEEASVLLRDLTGTDRGLAMSLRARLSVRPE